MESMIDHYDAVTIADRIAVPCFADRKAPRAKHDAIARAGITAIDVEVVAIARVDGSECLIDAFFDPTRFDTKKFGHIAGDPTFLANLKAALAARGYPSDTLAYTDEHDQEPHCVSLVAGPDFARAVIAQLDAEAKKQAA